jgi:hypothetical protein
MLLIIKLITKNVKLGIILIQFSSESESVSMYIMNKSI